MTATQVEAWQVKGIWITKVRDTRSIYLTMAKHSAYYQGQGHLAHDGEGVAVEGYWVYIVNPYKTRRTTQAKGICDTKVGAQGSSSGLLSCVPCLWCSARCQGPPRSIRIAVCIVDDMPAWWICISEGN